VARTARCSEAIRDKLLAEREGFEPSERLRAQRFSSSKISLLLPDMPCLTVLARLPFLASNDDLSSLVLGCPVRFVCNLVCNEIALLGKPLRACSNCFSNLKQGSCPP